MTHIGPYALPVKRSEHTGPLRMLPEDVGGDQAAFEALGFEFGRIENGKRMTWLPRHWRFQVRDETLSVIKDRWGRTRVRVFTTRALARMQLATVRDYAAELVLNPRQEIRLDDVWCTPWALRVALVTLRVNINDPVGVEYPENAAALQQVDKIMAWLPPNPPGQPFPPLEPAGRIPATPDATVVGVSSDARVLVCQVDEQVTAR